MLNVTLTFITEKGKVLFHNSKPTEVSDLRLWGLLLTQKHLEITQCSMSIDLIHMTSHLGLFQILLTPAL